MSKEKREVVMHPCSSCDALVDINEMDNYGRCERCQEEYPIEEDQDE